MRLIVVSPPTTSPGETALVSTLIERGLQTFHLRKPGHSSQQVGRYLDALPPACLQHVVTHQHFQLATEYNLKGVHLPELVRRSTSRVLRPSPEMTLSTAFHSASVHEMAASSTDDYDYVFLSPIFDSISKEGHNAAFSDRQQLASLVSRCPRPVYGLGGVVPGNLEDLQGMGFQGAVMLGGIWESPDPVESFAAAARVCAQLKLRGHGKRD